MASIATRTGDDGTTGLMFARRVSKADLRVDTYGTVDELNSALGMVRAFSSLPEESEWLVSVQKLLVVLMGELAVSNEDREAYFAKGHLPIDDSSLELLDQKVSHLETVDGLKFDGWATPGANQAAACSDLARTVCRRAERKVVMLVSAGITVNPQIPKFLNRLSDCLWLLARKFESQ